MIPDRRIGIILLGASEWPHRDELDSEAFARAAEGMRSYFRDVLRVADGEDGDTLDLFDDERAPSEQIQEIEAFLDGRSNIDFLFVFYAGHGTDDGDKKYRLLVRAATSHDLEHSSFDFAVLASAISDRSPKANRLFVVDACFSGSIQKALVDQPNAVAIVSSSGNATSSSDGPDDCTVFTGYLLRVLMRGSAALPERLTAKQVTDLTRLQIREHQGDGAVLPECHTPNLSKHDVASLNLFPNPLHHAPPRSSHASPPIRWCVVQAEASANSAERLGNILGGFAKSSQSYFNVQVGRGLDEEPEVYTANDAVSSPHHFADAIATMCRAELAFFDLSNFEPAVMLLLGIRAAVRRGVTVCTYGKQHAKELLANPPFHVREIVLQRGYAKDDEDIVSLLRQRAIAGLTDLKRWGTRYEDLPGYTALRSSPAADDLIPETTVESSAIVLCPFTDYNQQWAKLRGRWHDAVRGKFVSANPTIQRALDLTSTRLISQTLCSELRNSQVCIVDWTGWRPNVLFEMGLRLAVHPIPPLVFSSDEEPPHSLVQQDLLENLFEPFRYTPNDNKSITDQCRTALESHLASRARIASSESESLEGALPHGLVLSVCSKWLDWRNEPEALDVVSLLEFEADRLLADSSVGSSPVLFSANPHLANAAERNGRDRLLAAWYYLTSEDNDTPEMQRRLRLLGNRLIETLDSMGDTDESSVLAEGIRAKLELLD